MAVTVKALVAVGGSEWAKGGMHRVYFNGLSEWFGLETSRYNTGNISSAALNGMGISNSAAREIDLAFSRAKLYYDVAQGRFFSTGMTQSDHDTITARIRARVAELPAE